jgi:hypothetical protein
MEVWEVRLLEADGCAVGEMLRGEVEEGELTETGLVCVVWVAGAGDLGGGYEVMSCEVEGEFGVRAVRHLEVEDDVAAAETKVANDGCIAVRLLGLAECNGIGNLAVALEETEVFERWTSVWEESRINDGATLTSTGGDSNGSLVSEIVLICRLWRYCGLPEKESEEDRRFH